MNLIKIMLSKVIKYMDMPLALLLFIAALVMWFYRRFGITRFPASSKMLRRMKIFPLWDHYYDPLFLYSDRLKMFESVRALPGVDLNVKGQITYLRSLDYQSEVKGLPEEATTPGRYYFNNQSYSHGDAEIWYSILRATKPRRVIEIGSGFSTAMAKEAFEKNKIEDPSYKCIHTCIEPFPGDFLRALGVDVIVQPVEAVDIKLFDELEDGDILFIDSSHMIRPGGDILYEFQEILPRLKSGVMVHIHDIFTPRHYPQKWLEDNFIFWNEQYLLESFLAFNNSYKIILATNMMKIDYFQEMKRVCPGLTENSEPGAIYIKRL